MDEMKNPNNPAAFLAEELETRKKRNPGYSLRAFAKSLDMSPAQVSQLLNGKRNFTPAMLSKLSEALRLSPKEERELITQAALAKSSIESVAIKKHKIKEDEFQLIAQWYHFAILSLSKIKNAKADSYWISHRLGITVNEAREALARMTRMGVLAEGKELKQIVEPISVVSETPSRAIQQYHRRILHLAADKIESVPVEKRDYSAMTMAADPTKIDQARKIIEKFQDEMADVLQNKNAKEVYVISCQLFPLESERK